MGGTAVELEKAASNKPEGLPGASILKSIALNLTHVIVDAGVFEGTWDVFELEGGDDLSFCVFSVSVWYKAGDRPQSIEPGFRFSFFFYLLIPPFSRNPLLTRFSPFGVG